LIFFLIIPLSHYSAFQYNFFVLKIKQFSLDNLGRIQ